MLWKPLDKMPPEDQIPDWTPSSATATHSLAPTLGPVHHKGQVYGDFLFIPATAHLLREGKGTGCRSKVELQQKCRYLGAGRGSHLGYESQQVPDNGNLITILSQHHSSVHCHEHPLFEVNKTVSTM